MAELIPADYYPLPLREKRLVHDLRLLVEDPPPGDGLEGRGLSISYLIAKVLTFMQASRPSRWTPATTTGRRP